MKISIHLISINKPSIKTKNKDKDTKSLFIQYNPITNENET